jgi:hypothetical protein
MVLRPFSLIAVKLTNRSDFSVASGCRVFAINALSTACPIALPVCERLQRSPLVAGALEEIEYREKLAAAGFEQIEIEATRIYRVEDAREFLSAEGVDVDAIAPQVDEKFRALSLAPSNLSAPLKRPAVGPTCCN